MVKVRGVWTVLVASALVAVPGVARAAGPPGLITSETTLKVGQTGLVRMESYDANFKVSRVPVSVAVIRIEKGNASDLNGKKLPASAKGLVPWYIHESYTWANADFNGQIADFSGMYSDGSGADAVIGAGNVGDCPAAPNELKLTSKQRTVLACEVVLAHPGVPVVSAGAFFSNSEHDSFEVYWK
ncbi:MAG TPA: hypothetical protein VHV82_11180 [Sporichthyaceae bacterium]|jgi:hypothetical protein|nr:hypothetical protein [Sporichthyaceae bacterium]